MLCLTSGSLTGGGPPRPTCGKAHTEGWVVVGEGVHIETQLIIHVQAAVITHTVGNDEGNKGRFECSTPSFHKVSALLYLKTLTIFHLT